VIYNVFEINKTLREIRMSIQRSIARTFANQLREYPKNAEMISEFLVRILDASEWSIQDQFEILENGLGISPEIDNIIHSIIDKELGI
jgi:hypothetical protein